MRRNLHFGSVFSIVYFLFSCAGLHAQTETQTFDSEGSAESAGWIFNEEGQSTERYKEGETEGNRCREDAPCETNLGWKDSNFAGGADAGEGGGLVHRSGGLPIGFYADTSIGALTLDMPFSASGKVSLVNMNANGHYHFGFFDGQRVIEEPLDVGADVGAHLGFFLAEPGGGVQPNLRWGHTIRTDGGLGDGNHNGFVIGAEPDVSLDFLIGYDPTGDGMLTLLIGEDEPIVVNLPPELRDDTTTLTAFGVWTAATPSNARPNYMEIFLDDITYTSLDGGQVADLDFNDDTFIDVVDLDLLVGEIVANNGDTDFDLNGDGAVDDMDLSTWLSDAARDNGFGQPYLQGDANLDGSVNAIDLNALALRWQQQIATWSNGDFTADGTVNAADLNVLAINWQQEIPTAAPAVPEPTSAFLLLWIIFVGLSSRTFRRLVNTSSPAMYP